MDVKRGDRIRGWFGIAVVVDVAYGFVTDAATDEQVGPAENLIRIRQHDKDGERYYTFIYPEDIKEIL